MVRPRMRPLAIPSKVVVACILSTSLLHTLASAQEISTSNLYNDPGATGTDVDAASDATVDSLSVTTTEVCPISGGDIAVGIQAVSDPSCAAGGLGCYNTKCRYCKYSETDKSAHLLACSSFGANFAQFTQPTTSAPVDTEPCRISSGDLAVGIRAVMDVACANGGLGCFNDHCRFCKATATPQSAHLNDCSLYSVGGSSVAGVTAAAPSAPLSDNQGTTDDGLSGEAPLSATNPSDSVIPSNVEAPIETPPNDLVPAASGDIGGASPVAASPDEDKTTHDTGATTPVDNLPDVNGIPGTDAAIGGGAPTSNVDNPDVIGNTGPNEGTPSTGADTVTPTDTSPINPAAATADNAPSTGTSPADASAPATVSDVVPTGVNSGTSAAEPVPSDSPPTVFSTADVHATECTVDETFNQIGIDVAVDPTVVDSDIDYYTTGCRLCKLVDSEELSMFLNCALFSDVLIPSGESPVSEPSPSAPIEPSTAVEPTGNISLEPETPLEPTTPAGPDGEVALEPDVPQVPTTPESETPTEPAAPAEVTSIQPETPTEPAVAEEPTGGVVLEPNEPVSPVAPANEVTTETIAPEPPVAPTDNGDTKPTEPLTQVESTGGLTAEPIEPVTSVDPTGGDTAGSPEAITPVEPTNDLSTEPTEPLTPVESNDEGTTGLSVPTEPSPNDLTAVTSPDTSTCSVSSGDVAVGIQAVSDLTCVNGGLGCFDNVCRFCKVRSTPQSQHLDDCSQYGLTSIPSTAAPVPAASVATECSVSSGDAAVGIQAVSDLTCVNGGLGCFDNVCRFCKVRSTPQSQHLDDCSQYGLVKIPTKTTAPVATKCSVSEGDSWAGIQAVSDLTCVNGGLGCYSDVCRYCRVELTDESSHLDDCTKYGLVYVPQDTGPLCMISDRNKTLGVDVAVDPMVTSEDPDYYAEGCRLCQAFNTTRSASYTPCSSFLGYVSTVCLQQASTGDQNVGIQIVTDSSCKKGGVGCIDNYCRFCKTKTTPQSANFKSCPRLGSTATVSTPGNAIPLTCTETAMADETAWGLDVVTDLSCSDDGVGCFTSVCRVCQRNSTTVSASYLACSSLPQYDISGISLVPIPASGYDTSEPTTTCPPLVTASNPSPAAASTSPPTTAPPTAAPTPRPTTAPPTTTPPTNAPPTAAPTPSPTTAPPTTAPSPSPSETCNQVVSPGDAAAGLDIVTDTSCLSGGLGCIGVSVCRFCKKSDTVLSGYIVCPSATTAPPDATTKTPVATTAAPVATTAAPVEAVTPPAVITTTPTATCTQVVSPGDAAAGLDIITDLSCTTSGGAGCIGSSPCRFCKKLASAEPSSYIYCPGYPVELEVASTAALRVQSDAEASSPSSFTAKMKEFLGSDAAAAVGAVAAVCAGLAVVIAVLAIAIKGATRHLRRRRSGPNSNLAPDDEDDVEADERNADDEVEETELNTEAADDRLSITGVTADDSALMSGL